jgi:hypothetical protein
MGASRPEAELSLATRFIFDAFSSREPVPTSLENAIRLALLRLVVRRGRTLLVLQHELVEPSLVLGETQAVEEIPELDLPFLEPAHVRHGGGSLAVPELTCTAVVKLN